MKKNALTIACKTGNCSHENDEWSLKNMCRCDLEMSFTLLMRVDKNGMTVLSIFFIHF